MSSKPVSKCQQAIALFNSGDLKGCLRIVGAFRPSNLLSPQDVKVLRTGYESFVHANLMRQMGVAPVASIEVAASLFRLKFLKEKA